MVGVGAAHVDGVLGAGEQLTRRPDHSGTGAARADIDGDQKVPHRTPRPPLRPSYQAGQVAHIGEDGVGVEGGDLVDEAGRDDVATAGEGVDAHAGLLGRNDPGWAVLDDEAVLRRHSHAFGGEQEQVRSRLAVFDHGGRKDRKPEALDQPGELEAGGDALHLARGGDA